YLSPVEIPMLSDGGSIEAYLGTLKRLRQLVSAAEAVVPGHGAPLGREQATAVLEEDVTYLEQLMRDGAAAPLPGGRRTGTQMRIHEENVKGLVHEEHVKPL